jgi:hypothetical protein
VVIASIMDRHTPAPTLADALQIEAMIALIDSRLTHSSHTAQGSAVDLISQLTDARLAQVHCGADQSGSITLYHISSTSVYGGVIGLLRSWQDDATLFIRRRAIAKKLAVPR